MITRYSWVQHFGKINHEQHGSIFYYNQLVNRLISFYTITLDTT